MARRICTTAGVGASLIPDKVELFDQYTGGITLNKISHTYASDSSSSLGCVLRQGDAPRSLLLGVHSP
ncbi:MAG: hypothetical protein ACYTXA_22190 [Nostoc sp.]